MPNTHPCQLPDQADLSRLWRCPTCQSDYFWAAYWVGRDLREMWVRVPDNAADYSARLDAEHGRSSTTWAIIIGLIVAIIIVGCVALIAAIT